MRTHMVASHYIAVLDLCVRRVDRSTPAFSSISSRLVTYSRASIRESMWRLSGESASSELLCASMKLTRSVNHCKRQRARQSEGETEGEAE